MFLSKRSCFSKSELQQPKHYSTERGPSVPRREQEGPWAKTRVAAYGISKEGAAQRSWVGQGEYIAEHPALRKFKCAGNCGPGARFKADDPKPSNNASQKNSSTAMLRVLKVELCWVHTGSSQGCSSASVPSPPCLSQGFRELCLGDS